MSVVNWSDIYSIMDVNCFVRLLESMLSQTGHRLAGGTVLYAF